MKTFGDYIKEYVYYIPSDVMYVYESSEKDLIFDEKCFIEQRCESNRKINLMGMEFDWIIRGRSNARRDLPRSKYRKLCKRIERRFKCLRRRYENIK